MARAKSRQNMQEIQVMKILIMISVFALVVIGLVMVYSATSADLASAGKDPFGDVISQAIYALLGIIAAVVLWRVIPYRAWAGSLNWIIWGFCMLLLVLTFFMGTTVNGAKRWLYLFGVIGMQPSEFAKVALLLMTIRILNDWREGTIDVRGALVQLLLLIAFPLLFLYVTQSDLGTTLICSVGILVVMLIGGIPKRFIALIILAGVAVVAIGLAGGGYRSSRFVYLDPWNDGQGGLGAGYNIIRSYYALAEGGLFGVGIGNSHEKYQYLFASDTDFIFAVLGEELGLVGALIVIGLFLLLLYAGLKVALAATDGLAAMIAAGCTIMLVFQAFLNIGCAIGIFPTTGKPLPFISSGGTSVISSLVLIGLVLSVERSCEVPKSHERRRDELRVIRARRP